MSENVYEISDEDPNKSYDDSASDASEIPEEHETCSTTNHI